MNKNIMISWDLDGVLAKFDERIVELSGHPPRVLDEQGKLWHVVSNTPNFFKNLDLYPDMVSLFHEVKSLGVPTRVITGRPKRDTVPTATQDKLDWCAKHLGPDVDVIVCLSRDKQKHLSNNITDVLVDDRHKNVHNWRLAGGVSILHTDHVSTRSQLSSLLGI